MLIVHRRFYNYSFKTYVAICSIGVCPELKNNCNSKRRTTNDSFISK